MSFKHSASSRRSKLRQLATDAARLRKRIWCVWIDLPNGGDAKVLWPLGRFIIPRGVRYQTGPRFGQQLALSRKAAR